MHSQSLIKASNTPEQRKKKKRTWWIQKKQQEVLQETNRREQKFQRTRAALRRFMWNILTLYSWKLWSKGGKWGGWGKEEGRTGFNLFLNFESRIYCKFSSCTIATQQWQQQKVHKFCNSSCHDKHYQVTILHWPWAWVRSGNNMSIRNQQTADSFILQKKLWWPYYLN